MNTSIAWIRDLVEGLNVSLEEYTDKMTLTGTKVETVERFDKNLEKIVIGRIDKIEKHPDAEKLVVCSVCTGDETLQIVTGAPNVKEGQKVPCVLAGGKVAGGHDGGPLPEDGIKIKKGKLRGVESFGMLCSVEELGFHRDFFPDAPENGIYILPDDAPVGEDAVAYLGLRDAVVEYEVTSNRTDCFSVIGIAREAAASFSLPFCPPTVNRDVKKTEGTERLRVRIENPELCKRYAACIVDNLKIEPSPAWMQKRLRASGIRPINNVVDITNYVMLEYGQPMHAFDAEDVAGGEIIVRTAKDGDRFVTLDGQERELTSGTLMIADSEKAIGIAGIMGGENSKITDKAKTLIFESACFDGTNIRKSSKRLGLRTESSAKFEKGLSPEQAMDALLRARDLIIALKAGEPEDLVIDVYPEPQEKITLPFEPEKINRLLGLSLTEDEMLAFLKPLEILPSEDRKSLHIPLFRQDLLCTADIAEEVVRFYGYDKIPMTLPSGEGTVGGLSEDFRRESVVRSLATAYGFYEAMSYSFESPKVFDKLRIREDSRLREAIAILNPLGEDYSIMRTTPLNGILESMGRNAGHRNESVRLFELANIYLPESLPLTTLPDERMQACFALYGDGDFYTMKAVAEDLLKALSVRKSLRLDPNGDLPSFHPGRKAVLYIEDTYVGFLGELHPLVQETYGIKERCYVLVMDLPALRAFEETNVLYQGMTKFPAVLRDISMLLPKRMPVGEVEDAIRKAGGKTLEDLKLFDLYEGSQVEEGKKSVAFKLTLRAKDHTLSEEEVTKCMAKVLQGLTDLGLSLRA